MKLYMSFDGVHYRGADCGFCFFCGMPIRYEWVIFENRTGRRVTLCEKHYKKWEQKRDMALIKVTDQFCAELNELRDSH